MTCITHTKNSASRIRREPRYLFALSLFRGPGLVVVVVVVVATVLP